MRSVKPPRASKAPSSPAQAQHSPTPQHTPQHSPQARPVSSTITVEVQDYEAAYTISALLEGQRQAEVSRAASEAMGNAQQAEVFRMKAELLSSLVHRITRALVERRTH